MTPESYRKVRQTLDRRQSDLILLTERVHNPLQYAHPLTRTSFR